MRLSSVSVFDVSTSLSRIASAMVSTPIISYQVATGNWLARMVERQACRSLGNFHKIHALLTIEMRETKVSMMSSQFSRWIQALSGTLRVVPCTRRLQVSSTQAFKRVDAFTYSVVSRPFKKFCFRSVWPLLPYIILGSCWPASNWGNAVIT